jgi:hypothetical protein
MTRVAIRTLIALALLGSGWFVGRAQTPVPEFTLVIDAPVGETRVVCAKGCTLQGARDEGNPHNKPVPKYSYQCSGPNVQRCETRVNGWLTR